MILWELIKRTFTHLVHSMSSFSESMHNIEGYNLGQGTERGCQCLKCASVKAWIRAIIFNSIDEITSDVLQKGDGNTLSHYTGSLRTLQRWRVELVLVIENLCLCHVYKVGYEFYVSVFLIPSIFLMHRNFLGEDLERLSLQDLINLEHQINDSLGRVRSRKASTIPSLWNFTCGKKTCVHFVPIICAIRSPLI